MTPIELLAARLTGEWDAIVGIPRGGLIVWLQVVDELPSGASLLGGAS